MKDELSDLDVRLCSKTRSRQAIFGGCTRSLIGAAIMFIATALVLTAGLYDLLVYPNTLRNVPTLIEEFRTSASPFARRDGSSCDDVYSGYQCQTDVSHSWGQYSSYFTVPSEISADVPPHCRTTFAQVLSRHGARFPTASKTTSYNATIAKVHKAKSYGSGYEFLKNYTYTLGADNLTAFGQQQLVNSGIKYYNRYKGMTTHWDVFIRAAGDFRVVDSAQHFAIGYHTARLNDTSSTAPDHYPYPILVIPEDEGQNNTLNHELCTAFENGTASTIGGIAQKKFMATFIGNITSRLNANLPGANLTDSDSISMMDLCPFNTVADVNGAISKFCSLFSKADWVNYDYYQSVGKYYGYGGGNPLGPTQGVGFTNELIARLNNTPVVDHTTVNHTLDDHRATFPISGGKVLYADFSHDNDMTSMFFAMGLYNTTAPLSNTTVQSVAQTHGYSAAYTVPFAARAYFEKMSCTGTPGELVRVLVNDRVIPLPFCGGDELGRCTLENFVNSLTFAQQGGHWDQCFV